MSNQKFSSRERLVFWEVYSKKCHYCKKDLLLSEIVLDHVVPEELLDLPEAEFESKLQDLNLASSFDIKAYENIVVSCGPCNGEKGALNIYDRFLGIVLARAAENGPKIRKRVNARTRAASAETLMLGIAASIEAGHTTGQALVNFLKSKGYLSLISLSPSSSEIEFPLVSSKDRLRFSPLALRDLCHLGDTLNLDNLIDALGSPETKILKMEKKGEGPIFTIVSGEMYYKFQRRENYIYVFSAHFA